MRLDNDSIKIDAFKQCRDPQFILRGLQCSNVLYEDYPTIYNNLLDYVNQNVDTNDPNSL